MPERAIPVNVYQFLKNCQKSFRLLKSSKNPQLYCQHVQQLALWRKNCQKSFHLLKSSKHPQLYCQHVQQQLANVSAQMQLLLSAE